jgi:hypothetical protein
MASLLAIAGLVFAGKTLSERDSILTDDASPSLVQKACDARAPREHALDYMENRNLAPDLGRRIGDFRLTPKNEISSLQNSNTVQYPFGQPVYDFTNRQNISNKMNNTPPVTRQNIGPGLGVGPDVASAGGFQQLFRILPNNVNDERLIALKGTSGGPANPVVKGGNPIQGDVTHFPDKVYYRAPAQTSGQGQGGVLRAPEAVPQFTKTERSTIRQQTGSREGDFLQFGPGQASVYQAYGETNTFMKDRENRSKLDRPGNGQRMNVRADPLDAGGLVTNLRRENETSPPGGISPGTGLVQNYINAGFYDLNELKSQLNPLTHDLSLAKSVNKNNYLAMPLS